MSILGKLVIAVLAVVVAGLTGRMPATGSAQTPTLKLRIAVLPLADDALSATTAYMPGGESTTIEIPPPEGFALGLTEMLTTALVESGKFVVLERSQIDRVLAEQDFGASGRVNPETAPAVGRAIGAAVMITGAITEYSYKSSSIGGAISALKGLKVSARKLSAAVGLDLRVLDAATGEVLCSQRGSGEASARTAAADVSVGEQEFATELAASTPLGRASRQAIEEVVAGVVDALAAIEWTGRIIDVREGLIYVNAGSEAGIEPGMEFDVYAQQEPLIDPATGQALGSPERYVGKLRVTQVEDKYAVAEAVDGDGFGRNQLLRFAGQHHKR